MVPLDQLLPFYHFRPLFGDKRRAYTKHLSAYNIRKLIIPIGTLYYSLHATATQHRARRRVKQIKIQDVNNINRVKFIILPNTAE